MELTGKRLLLMGGGAFAKSVKKYADEKGFYMIGVGASADTPVSKIANEFYEIDTQDVDAVSALVLEKKIDGIFVGSSEVNIVPAIAVSERTGCRFYVNRNQWDLLSNKARFKELAQQFGVPVPQGYQVTEEFRREDLDKIKYPVIVKPVDGAGARGMNPCYNEEELKKYYLEALNWSKSKKVVVEELITEGDEVFFQYTIQDGECSLTSCFTKVFVKSQNKNLILPLFHMYPSKHIDVYFADVHENAKKLFRAANVNNGVMTLQSFYKEGRFYFFEAGFRMGGAQNYILTDYQWGFNPLECMINYALTGKMSDTSILEVDNAKFRHPCCNYYVGLKPGTIAKMGAVEETEKLPGVLNITRMCSVGKQIPDTNALQRICLRIHVVGETAEKLAENLVRISKTLDIRDENGNDMQLEPLEYERCLDAVRYCCMLNN